MVRETKLQKSEKIQKVFEMARWFIEKPSSYGLKLSLIELCRLKNDYVIPSINENCKGWSGYFPHAEAAARFLNDYYGIPANDKHFVQQLGSDFAPRVREYLKLIQEKSHLP